MAHADELHLPAFSEFSPASLRGAEGFFRVGQDAAGRWWLIDPADRAFFAKAVHGVSGARQEIETPAPMNPAARLRQWGFNAAGAGGDGTAREDGLPFLMTVDFCRAASPIVAPGTRLPDVFSPDWPQIAAAHAIETCAPLADTRELIGWMSDDTLAWAQPSGSHATSVGHATPPTLLQLCLSLEPSFAAYHAAWEFALALHGGRLAALARAWGVALANKEVVRELTRAETGIATRGYLRDEARWTREFARRYFTTTAAAIRAADPHHLVLGCRFGAAVGPHVLAECVYPAVDVAMPVWTELPAAATDEEVNPPNPVLAGDVCWAEENFLKPPPRGAARKLTSVERMLRRGRASLERTARHPAAVGYAWAQWQDEPGEQPPFARGLVHRNGVEAREHTELLAAFNARAETLRGSAIKSLSS